MEKKRERHGCLARSALMAALTGVSAISVIAIADAVAHAATCSEITQQKHFAARNASGTQGKLALAYSGSTIVGKYWISSNGYIDIANPATYLLSNGNTITIGSNGSVTFSGSTTGSEIFVQQGDGGWIQYGDGGVIDDPTTLITTGSFTTSASLTVKFTDTDGTVVPKSPNASGLLVVLSDGNYTLDGTTHFTVSGGVVTAATLADFLCYAADHP